MDDNLDNIGTAGIRCRCLGDCPDNLDNTTCLLKRNAKCFKKIAIVDGIEEITAGCLGSQEEYIDQCNPAAAPSFSTPTTLACCNNVTLCNDYLVLASPKINKNAVDVNDQQDKMNFIAVIIIAVFIFLVIFGTMIGFYRYKTKQREKKKKRQIEVENRHAGCPVLYGDTRHCRGKGKHKPIGDMIDEWSSIGATTSGSGMPLLVQRTISKQIEIIREIGRGRYGTVVLGKWRDENVALKIFNSTDEESWYRETEIYQTVLLRHHNILGFIAADISGTSCSWTQLFLITEYHENGSLFDYLQNKILDVSECLKLAYTACCGLAHLHTEITGTQGKPAIAHRDVKSRNILVKQDGQCCIADMGLAVRYSRLEGKGKVDIGSYDRSRRQGTIRYMPPEVLTQTYHPDSFAAYKAADVYSYGLVMWEIANRTVVKGTVDEYRLPYYDVVSNNPDFDEMRKVVAIEHIRPEVLPEWNTHRVMSTYVKTMQECWVARHESRLSMLRVRKTFNAINEGLKMPIESTSSDSSSTDRKPTPSSTANSSSSNLDEISLITPPDPPGFDPVFSV